ncbi:MAG: hypothetical protein LAQ69_31290 [Acidobacteriia bacterium]|nr:hypothetical protein [Terriglobia bacterium]
MLLRLVLLCVCVTTAHSQQDWNNLLDRVRDRVRETIQRLPNYMCTETVDRTQYQPHSTPVPSCTELIAGQNERKIRPATSDRLRLDVAVAKTGEMYSWVGESGFHDQSLGDLVKEGATSTGSFSAFLHVIFESGAITFSYNGEKTEAGRLLAEFAFRVSQQDSQYSFGYRTGRVMTGYYGTFLVDPKTSELVRLVIHTDKLPGYTESCQASTTLDYSRVVLHGSDFLLPSESRLRIIDANGTESENRTVFSACHEFLGESTLSFDSSLEKSPSASGKGAVAQAALPAGLEFQLALTQDIDTASAAVGDPIQARLTTAIPDRSSKILVPAGASVSGRIVELRRFYPPSPSWSIVLRMDTLKAGGMSRPFMAVVDPVGRRLAGSRGGKGVLLSRATPGLAAIEFGEMKPNEVIQHGQEMKWVTVSPSQASPAKTESSARTPPQTGAVPSEFRPPENGPAQPAGSQPGFVPADAMAPSVPRNLAFKEGAPGEIPPAWLVPTRSAGYSAEIRSEGCTIGPRCAVVLVPPHPPANSFGNLMQSFDASPYRGKTIRLHAWLRVEPAARGNRAQMWLRVDRENGQMGFFDNMGNRPVTSGEWKECEIRGRVDHDAYVINIGVMALGKGRAWIDGIDFGIVPPSARR